MEYIFDYPWVLGLILTIVLAIVLDLGRRSARHFKVEKFPPR